jgi:uracil-DNA glycosylase family 4
VLAQCAEPDPGVSGVVEVSSRGRGVQLAELAHEIEGCRRCPRLVAWREQVARERRAAFAHERYAAHPVAGFGDPAARVLILGLAPAAHGGNRTGRIFTGDRSGDFLFAALWRAGFANQPTSTAREDGLRVRDAWITAAVRCAPPANRPAPSERDACLPWSVAELRLLPGIRVALCLGGFAWDAALRLRAAVAASAAQGRGSEGGGAGSQARRSGPAGDSPQASVGASLPRPRPRFGHGAEHPGEPFSLLGCFHPSQQNTFTGKLTEPMIDAVLQRARTLAESD